MTHPEEHALYLTDRRAWAEYVAPNWRRMLLALTGEAKQELKDKAKSPELRAAIRALAELPA